MLRYVLLLLACIAPLALCDTAQARPHVPAKVAKGAFHVGKAAVTFPVKLTANQVRRLRANGTHRRSGYGTAEQYPHQGAGNRIFYRNGNDRLNSRLNYCPTCK